MGKNTDLGLYGRNSTANNASSNSGDEIEEPTEKKDHWKNTNIWQENLYPFYRKTRVCNQKIGIFNLYKMQEIFFKEWPKKKKEANKINSHMIRKWSHCLLDSFTLLFLR